MKPTTLIIGGTSGIGLATAKHLSDFGHRLIIIGRDKGRLAEAVEFIRPKQEILTLPLDMRHRTSINELFLTLNAQGAYPNNFVWCPASIQPIGRYDKLDDYDIENSIQMNLVAPMVFTNRLLIELRARKQNGRRMILFAGGGDGAMKNFTSYATAKAAICRFVENLSYETGHLDFNINAVAPGFVWSPIQEEVLKIGPKKAGEPYYEMVRQRQHESTWTADDAKRCIRFLLETKLDINGRVISAKFDDLNKMETLLEHQYRLRRITSRDGKCFVKNSTVE